jgi:hypothetical protein
MTTPHIWEPHRDVCFCCGRTRQDVLDRNLRCDGVVKYREWLRGLTFSREPIVPTESKTDG